MAPGRDIFSRYRSPRSHLRHRAHTSEVTTFMLNLVLSMDDTGAFFLAAFVLLTVFISHGLDDALYERPARLVTVPGVKAEDFMHKTS